MVSVYKVYFYSLKSAKMANSIDKMCECAILYLVVGELRIMLKNQNNFNVFVEKPPLVSW